MTGLILVGLVPFVALGVLMGHMLTTDSIGPAMGGTTALLSLLGGVWFPVNSGALHDIAEALPSYWLVQASHVALGGRGWSALGWVIMAAWAVVLAVGAGLGLPARHPAGVGTVTGARHPSYWRVTRLTSLPGTTISFTTVVPSRWRTTFGSARASARTPSRSRSTGALNCPRSLPFTCTA